MKHVDSSFKSPLTSISIGPGIRGIERGVERVAKLVHLAYVEIEAFIVENLVAQMERSVLDPAIIWSDAKTLPCEPFRGLVDILLAGYPCQPFSTAGKRKGTDDPRHLYPYIERAIDIIRPRICFFENVRGHVTCGLPEVIASLEGLGYRVHWGIYSAEETGAAHKRERVFIMAYASGAGKWRRERHLHQANGRPDGELPFITDGSSSELAYDYGIRIDQGLERRQSEQFDQDGGKWIVSRPGQPQQAWEHPRVISRKVESAVGLSAHGYHFREDILRALGNSVYEDTAELAFRDLLRKHGITP